MIDLIFTEEQFGVWVYYEYDTFWELKQMLDAVGAAKTWGEFRSMLPDGKFEALDEWKINGGEKVYWDGNSYLYISPEEIPSYLQEVEGEEDFFIVRSGDSFDNSWFSDALWPDFEKHIWDKFPSGFLERFQAGTTWALSKPTFNEDDFEEMEKLLRQEGFEVSNIGCVW